MSGRELSGARLALAAAAPVGALLSVFASNGLAPLAGLVALVLLVAALRHDARLLATAPAGLVLATLAWMVASIAWAIVPRDALSTLYGLAPLLLGGAVIVSVAARLAPADVARLLWPLLIGYFLLLGLIAVELATGGLLRRSWFALRGAPLAMWYETDLSRAIVLAALLVWPCALLLWRRRASGPLLLCGVAILVTAWGGDHYSTRLALLLGLGTTGFVWWLGRRAAAGVAAALVLLVAVAPLLPLGPLSPANSGSLAHAVRNSGLHRLYIWQFAAERIAERPLAGWGLDSSRSMPGGDAPTPAGSASMMMHPHNGALQVWLELGVPGMLALAGVVALIGRGLWRIGDRGARALATGQLVTAAVLVCMSFGIWQTWWVATLGLALGWTVAALRAFAPAEEGA